MVKYFIVTIMLLLRHQLLLTQNLVPNNSFESYKKCPDREAQFNGNVLKWKSANKATPDYFNSCSLNDITNTYANFGGKQLPYSGSSYAAITLYDSRTENFREYIQCKLISPLKTNHLYCFSFYASLSDKSMKYTDRLGIYVSKNQIKKKDKFDIKVKPQIENKESLYLSDKIDWVLICDTLRAIGGEQYITIGNFFNDKNTGIKDVDNIQTLKKKYSNNSYYNSNMDGAYYYIDEVSVVEITDKNECNCRTKSDSIIVNLPKLDSITPKIGESVILKNLMFATNKSEILPESFEELNKLASYLHQYKQYRIEISGYTDNVGKEEENQKLSESRAKAVANYLVNKGIDKNRISYKGYGSNSPIATNKSEEGRQQNRRVAFQLEHEN